MMLFRYILLLIITATLSQHSFSQNNINELLSGGSNSDALEAESSSINNSVPSEEEFLPVEEAYQLSVVKNQDGISLDWVIADKYFLYGEQFRATANDQALKLNIPEGIIKYDPIFEKDVEKHYQYVQILIDSAQLPPTPFELKVTSQGCANAGLCYPPQTLRFNVTSSTITPSSEADAIPNDSTSTQETPELTTQRDTASFNWKTTLTMLLFAIIGGAVLNLMPCVLPVLSLKALSLANSQQSHRAQGWSYTLGVVTTFVAIAILLLAVRTAGQSVGWGFQLQSPSFVTLLIYLFFVMGLSLSGFITIGTRWMSMGQSLTQGTGLKQSYFTGVLAAVVASPCTAPFMAPALGFAITQPWIVALLIFAGLGLGMALPLLILSYLPHLEKWLPKPGAWMETFKQALAFPLYLTAIWLLWVLSRQLGGDSALIVLIGALLIVFIFWLGKHLQSLASIAGIFSLVITIFISVYSHQQPLETVKKTASEWEPYNEERFQSLRNQGKAIFVNLTADWCITCLANEKVAFTDETITIMKEKDITLIKGDWTNYDPQITRLLEKYGRGGVPLYLLYPAEAGAEAIVLPQILSPGKFKRTIDAI